MLDDRTLALLGDRDAQERITERGELLECPHRKSKKLKVEHKSRHVGFTGLDDRVEYHTYSVRCNVCHARGPAHGGKVIVSFRYLDVTQTLPEWATTPMELSEAARLDWNTRAPILTETQLALLRIAENPRKFREGN